VGFVGLTCPDPGVYVSAPSLDPDLGDVAIGYAEELRASGADWVVALPRTSRPLAILVRRPSFRQRMGSYGIIGSTMWKRLLAGIFGLVGLVVWRRFLGEGSEVHSAPRDTIAGTLQDAWAKSGSMSGREIELFMADLFRTAGYKVDVVGGTGDQGVDLPIKKGGKLIAVQCKKYGRPVGNAAVSAIYAGAKHYGAKQA
jgi:hypothetical protein